MNKTEVKKEIRAVLYYEFSDMIRSAGDWPATRQLMMKLNIVSTQLANAVMELRKKETQQIIKRLKKAIVVPPLTKVPRGQLRWSRKTAGKKKSFFRRNKTSEDIST